MSRKLNKKQSLKKKLDKLVQEKGMQMCKVCLVCGGVASCRHHYIQKSQSLNLRWDFRNLVPICSHCHTVHHKSGDPRIHQIILKKKGHKWADELQADRRIVFKDSVSNLEAKVEELGG